MSTAKPAWKTAASGAPVVLPTPVGDAGLALDKPARNPRALLVLGHGAGGGIDAPDLIAAAAAARAAQWVVARVVQPYRLAGRRAPAPAAQLDAAWMSVVAALRTQRALALLPLVLGGRSSGARVACRTAVELSAASVLALAFPLHPPGRPERSRADELAQAGVPVYVVQGERDAFGSGADIAALRLPHVNVRAVPGDHALRTAAAASAVAEAVSRLDDLLSR